MIRATRSWLLNPNHPSIVILLLSCGIVYLLWTASSADLETFQKRDNEILGPLDDKSEIRQSFTSSQSHLASIELLLVTNGYSHKGEFEINVQLEDESGGVIAAKSFEAPESPQPFDIRFTFKPQSNSYGTKYLLRIHTNAPPQTINMLGSGYDSYPGGTFQMNETSETDDDLAFFTYSHPSPSLLRQEFFSISLPRLTAIAVFSLAFFSLGAVPVLLLHRSDDLLELIGFSLVTGMAIPPVVLFFFSLLGIKLHFSRMPAYAAWLLPGACLLAAISIFSRLARRNKKEHGKNHAGETIIFSSMLILACLTRLIQVSEIIVPNGVGSFTHFRLMERIIREGTVPLASIYHLGFHSNALMMDWLTGLNLPESTLILGMLLSILSGLSFHLLARRLLQDVTLALIATGFYWFISPIPALLLNGDRLPFLQAMTMFPSAVLIIRDSIHGGRSIKILGWLLAVGLFLTHYSTIVFLACMVAATYIQESPEQNPLLWKVEKGGLPALLFWSVTVILVLLIKIYFVLIHGPWEKFFYRDPALIPTTDYELIFQNLARHGGWILWLAGLLGLALQIRLHPRLLQWVYSGVAILLVMNWLQYISIGHVASNPKNILYFLSIPLSMGAGILIFKLAEGRKLILHLLLPMFMLAGAYNISGILEPRNIFFSAADGEAMEWINRNVPAGSTFLINSYPFDWTYNPTDGGGWIPFMTDSKAVYPKSSSEYATIRDFANQNRVEYIYIGSGYGELTPETIHQIPSQLVYSKDGIYIYQIISS